MLGRAERIERGKCKNLEILVSDIFQGVFDLARIEAISRSGDNWQNWGKTSSNRVEHVAPRNKKEVHKFILGTNLAQIAKIVKKAKLQKKKIRVVGDGHSWSPIIAADDVFLLHLVSEKWKKIIPLQKGM